MAARILLQPQFKTLYVANAGVFKALLQQINTLAVDNGVPEQVGASRKLFVPLFDRCKYLRILGFNFIGRVNEY